MHERDTHRWIISAVAILVVATTALAASVHFKPRDPSFIDQGTTLLMTGSLAGLGEGDVTVLVEATGAPTVICTNKGGGQAPGQNPADVTVSGATTIPEDRIENGQLFVTVTTQPPAAPNPAQVCPNANWHTTVLDVAFESATVTVLQNGVVVLQETHTL